MIGARDSSARERDDIDGRSAPAPERDDAARVNEADDLAGSGGQAAREEHDAPDHIDYAVDDLRPSRLSAQRAARRAHGPLGIRDPGSDQPSPRERNDAEDSSPPEDSRPTSPGPAVMRLNVVEVNTTVETSAPAASGGHELDGNASALDRVAELPPARSEGELEPSHERPGEPFQADAHDDDAEPTRDERGTRGRPSARPSLRASRLARASVRPSMRASARAGDGDADERPTLPEGVAAELSSRSSLSSVLGARPSFRPSPMPPPRSRLGWWVLIGLLSTIIGAAVLVAARERWSEPNARTPVASVPTVPAKPTPASAAAAHPEPAQPEAVTPGASASPQVVAPAAPRVHVEQAATGTPSPRPRPRPLAPASVRKTTSLRARVPAAASASATPAPATASPAAPDPSVPAMGPETVPAPANAATAAAAAALSAARAAFATPSTVVAPPSPPLAPAASGAPPATGAAETPNGTPPAANPPPSAPTPVAPPAVQAPAAGPAPAPANTAGHGINPYAD